MKESIKFGERKKVNTKASKKLGVKCCYRNINFLQRFLSTSSALLCRHSTLVVTRLFLFVLRLIGTLNAEGSLSPARIRFSYAQLLENDQIVSVQTRHFIVQYE